MTTSFTDTLGTVALAGATVTTAMVAGLLFSWAHDVMPALGTLDDAGFLTSFRRLDAAIQNPWMMATFVGSPLLVVAALLLRLPNGGAVVVWLGAARRLCWCSRRT